MMIEFLKLFVLLYADDTIIVAENAHDLQNALNIYEHYCTVNKLTIKTCNFFIIFSKGRLPYYGFTFVMTRLMLYLNINI